MAYFRGSLTRVDGSPIVAPQDPHNCYFPTGWNKPYSHTTVAVILTNPSGEIAAVVARHPEEPAEGGKLALPGGYVELGQRLAEAAETEALEETGHLIVPRSLGRFALMDGPLSLPGRQNEHDFNIVHVFSARAGAKVQEHDDEVTEVLWIARDAMPLRSQVAFGHYDIMGMWFRHQVYPFEGLPIVPSEMNPDELFLPGWPLDDSLIR
ncbi:MAG TPA: NUDIX domain-containing protein [Candidatus Saccharimonadales bacterium]|nr:NUDIX domain-containing protein [Candidatus Saccharimonadales bacterium]